LSAGSRHGTGKHQGFGHRQDDDLIIQDEWSSKERRTL